MNQILLALQAEQSELKNTAAAIKYCYEKIIFNQENRVTYTKYLQYILEEMTPIEFFNTFKQLRAFSYGCNTWRWLDINESIVKSLPEANSTILWCWLVCHPNGYVREYALQKMIGEASENRLLFLLVTLNDHVKTLREVASQELEKNFSQTSEETLIFSFPLIKHLKKLEHKENQFIYERLTSFLVDSPKLLFKAQDNQDFNIARYAFEWSFALVGEQRKQALRNGLKSTDRIILIWTFRELQKEAHWESDYLKGLLNHPHMIIRKLSCEWCYNNREKEERMLPKLLDRTIAIKALALDYVRKQFPTFDCHAYYLQHLIETPVSALQGLAILQDIRDRERMLPRIHSAQKKVRMSVITWASCLPLDEQLILYMDCLADSSREVRTKAVDQLSKHYSLNIKERLIPLFKTKRELYFQLNVLKILNGESRKDYFFDLILLYVDAADQRVAEDIERRLMEWWLNWNQRFFLQFNLIDKVNLTYLLNKHHEVYSKEVEEVLLKVIQAK
ncbi:hypothetical protein JZO78_15175 [Enterococcus ureilyticus]|uniref:hypothetical protein n=1 Tax=Enterococcus ureilyticus TaxID=1131292 RepID=UPI001A934BAC|nr:hypothetical protein [Enterococcus ureilyticus]MBO0447672.1 hypothetical protein [Enterococcus ureilyticus]